MHEQNLNNAIRSAIAWLSSSYPEFGYLVWTGMFENQVRDAVACTLLSTYSIPLHYVCREYATKKLRRVDLAIANKSGGPQVLVEFKQMYTYDFFTEARKRSNDKVTPRRRSRSFFGRVVSDAAKLSAAPTPNVEKYVVLIAAHLVGNPVGHQYAVPWLLRYASDVSRAYKSRNDTAVLAEWTADIATWHEPIAGSIEESICQQSTNHIAHFKPPILHQLGPDVGAPILTRLRFAAHDIDVTWRIWKVL